MAVKIRLKRIGAKKHPCYRIVVADSRYPRDGRFIEQIGTYDPMVNPEKITVDGVRALKWIKNGAQPTDTVRAILKKTKALELAVEQLAQQEREAKDPQAAQAAQAAKQAEQQAGQQAAIAAQGAPGPAIAQAQSGADASTGDAARQAAREPSSDAAPSTKEASPSEGEAPAPALSSESQAPGFSMPAEGLEAPPEEVG